MDGWVVTEWAQGFPSFQEPKPEAGRQAGREELGAGTL